MNAPTDTENRGHGVEPARVFTPGRIVALALIAVAVAGLAYLRFQPDDSVSVPSGAKAGDLVLEPCEYGTEDGSYAADCGTLVVPENRADPRSRLIALPVTRIRAGGDNAREPIFRLEGGPGGTNMDFDRASRFAENHDVVLVGYRGVDGSVRLDCPEVESALAHSTDLLAEKSLRAYVDAYRACADRLTGQGVDLAGYGLTQQVDDLEAARVALGYDRINLLSESAGTRKAMVYAWRYPGNVHRSVMVGVNPPGHFVWDGKTTDEQIRRYAELCSEDDGCSKRTDDLAAAMKRTAADMPERWWWLPIKDGNVRLASFWGLMESTPENAPLWAAMTIDSWLSAADGDASGLWLQSLLADLVFPKSVVWGEYAAVARADAQAAREHFSYRGPRDSILDDAATAFVWGAGRLADAWPAGPGEEEYRRVRTSDVETLLVSGALDFATPPQPATKELLPHLPNGHQVVLDGFGHSTSFWEEQPEAGSRLINTFYDNGRVDDSLYEPDAVDFTPSMSQGAIAKIALGAMLGLAALTIVSLLWMPLRVRRRGGFGRIGSAAVRSLYALVLGLGGWVAGALIVLTALPGVPLDDELLSPLAVGLPIGVGLYFAWVNRDWFARTKATGFAAAAGGALVGARLGFNATEGLVALFTTALGATAGGNLLLLGLDVAWDRQLRDRFAATSPKETLEAHPSTG